MPIDVLGYYSSKDKWFRDQLDAHLTSVKSQMNITIRWYDDILGANREKEILERDNNTPRRVILLLISKNSLDSGLFDSINITRGGMEQASIIPIRLSPCDCKGKPFADLQMLPSDGKSVSEWGRRDGAFYDIVQGIRAVLEDRIGGVGPPANLENPKWAYR